MTRANSPPSAVGSGGRGDAVGLHQTGRRCRKNRRTHAARCLAAPRDPPQRGERGAHRVAPGLLDPHGAVGFKALNDYLSKHRGEQGIFLETAHPVKFYDVVEPVINAKVPLPAGMQEIMKKSKVSKKIGVEYGELKTFLLKV